MELRELLTKIESLRRELDGYQPLRAERQANLDKKFRLEFNYNSNHIEGNTLTYGETALYLIFDKTTGDHEGREYEEMKASDVALKLIQEFAEDKERPLTEAFIKNLNKIILVRPYWANAITPDGQNTRREITIGDYKKHPNSVRLQNGEMFHYASPQETPALMTDLVRWYEEEAEKKENHPVELAALLHYRFVRIHPFDDGNGRLSRLLMNYVLYRHNYPPVIIKSTNKRDYLFALNQADTGDIAAFEAYIAKQMLWSLELSIKAAKGEDIEEPDGVEKEITVFKRELKNKKPVGAVHKRAAMEKLYSDYLSGFIRLFEQKISSSFRELFVATVFIEYANESVEERVAYVDDVMAGRIGKILPENVYFIKVSILLNHYQRNKNNFGVRIDLEIVFNEDDYQLKVDVSKYFTKYYPENRKPYSQVFTQEEQQTIINETLKKALSYIQENTDG